MATGSAPLTEPIGAPKYAGITWADFKRAIERLGITDATEIASVEYGISQYGSGRLVAEHTDSGMEVREL